MSESVGVRGVGGVEGGVVLGQYDSRVIDMASAYGTLAASGMFHSPHFVQKVALASLLAATR